MGLFGALERRGTRMRMRIRWTTRIAMAVGVLTLIAGVTVGGPAGASAARAASSAAAAGSVTAAR
jgi:hypothetical protein